MIGFIGLGNMGTAIFKRVFKTKAEILPSSFYLHDINHKKIKDFSSLGVNPVSEVEELVEKCQYIFLAIKPNDFDSLMMRIKNLLNAKHVLISVLAGINLSYLERSTQSEVRWVRVMPNTPSLIGKGVGALSFSKALEEVIRKKILGWFNHLGNYFEIDESKMDAITALTGSGPAFVYTFIQALADGGVYCGLSRAVALDCALALVKGSCSLMEKEKNNKHPYQLRDEVASPGGTTIAGISELSKRGFESSIQEAMKVTFEKSKSISKK